jgi:hypothetical protein
MATTNPSQSALDTANKYLNSVSISTGVDSARALSSPVIDRRNYGERAIVGVSLGALPTPAPATQIVFQDVNGKKLGKDLRTKIRVPNNYLVGQASTLSQLGGVIFPYTPSINYEYKADYSSSAPMHSNFSINFYQKSRLGDISVSGKFTVENSKDAEYYLATVHLLRALTKMRSGGGSSGDADSGAPPPVCRLYAYGENMVNNVPVAISSVRIELQDGVDYFNYQAGTVTDDFINAVPTVSTIAITCIPMYSRREMQQFSVTGYLTNSLYRKQGYL